MAKTRFRDHLARWFLGATSLAGLPLVVLTVIVPWERLDVLVRTSEAVLSAPMGAFPAEDLVAMNTVALAVVDGSLIPPAEAPGPGFVLLTETGRPPTLEEATAALQAQAPGAEVDVAAAVASAGTWAERLATLDGGTAALEAFRRGHARLANTRRAAERVRLKANDVYLTVDLGTHASPFFKDNVAFVLGAHPWWEEPLYPGQGFDVAAIDGGFWRASYLPELGGEVGTFGHNPPHDPILPRFERDEWGTWYSVWGSLSPAPGQWNSLTMDIDASLVRERMRRAAFLGFLVITALWVVVAVAVGRVAKWVSRPVAELQRGAQAVLALQYDHTVPEVGEGELGELIETFNRMVSGLRQRANLLGTLEKLLSTELAHAAAENGLTLGGQEVEATVLFTDFAGFSTLTQSMRAVDVVAALNDYFLVLVPIIKKWGGFPDKYIGDAIVVLFGAPLAFTDHAQRAVRCAVEMQQELRVLNYMRQSQGKVVFEMRVGINTGEVVVGAIGCDAKLEFTSIGETTNLANRMESACPVGHVMIAAGTHAKLSGDLGPGVTVGALAPTVVKGYPEPVLASAVWVDALRITKAPAGGYVYTEAG